MRISIIKDFVMKSGSVETGEVTWLFLSSIDQRFILMKPSSLNVEGSVVKVSLWYVMMLNQFSLCYDLYFM